jgi:hypothetical protein
LASDSNFARTAAEARRLAARVGGGWAVFVERSIDAGDAAGLKSQIVALNALLSC